MVGLVFVSHSRPLAEALVNLVKQVSSGSTPIAIAAGVGADRQEFGTDAVEITEAIRSVYSPDGVLVLMDLGSAVLSAQMALELLDAEMQPNVRFCPAPIVEGAIAAGVQAGLGSDLETVFREAQGALIPKSEQLNEALPGAAEMAPGAPQPDGQPSSTDTLSQDVLLTLHNQHGLHARPAARFVQMAASFEADIRVRNVTKGKGPVSARSLNALATLGAVNNHQIALSASGPQAVQALQALSRLIEDNFGESAAEIDAMGKPVSAASTGLPTLPLPTSGAQAHEGVLQAIPISEGIALGPLYHYQPTLPPIPQTHIENPQPEWERLQRALESTRQAILKRRQELSRSLGDADAAIFDAHLLILQDPDLLDQVHKFIFEDYQNAALAWQAAISQVAQTYLELEDPYQKQRAVDVQDVGNQLLFALAEKAASPPLEFPGPVILFAQELTPTETSQMDMSMVLGIATVGGGPTSHSAILARGMGIPAVAGVSLSLEKLAAGTPVALDGSNGRVWIEPSKQQAHQLSQQRQAWLDQRLRLLQASGQQALTRDGQRVEVVANVGNVMDARTAVDNGAEGIGLLRTEFLYLTRSTPPSEAEQVEVLHQIGEAMGDRPIIVRTLDVGGDKDLPYLSLPAEPNPFLGVRAIRLCLRQPELFRTQLRAILRAGVGFHFKIMFPMVASVEEVDQVHQFLESVHANLLDEGLPHVWPVETGIMVEIPSAAILSPVLAKKVDFFSIGTNDLTQYTLAAERGNPALSGLADALHPAVLHLIRDVAVAAHQQKKWVGVCGELAGDPAAVAVLVGLGVDELSMNSGSIPRAKAILRAITSAEAQELASQLLETGTAQEARSIARAWLGEKGF